MPSRRFFKFTIVSGAAIALALVVFAITFHSNPELRVTKGPVVIVKKSPQLSLPAETVYGLPVRLKIPTLNVDANILDMGLTGSGNMDVPSTLVDVGWYKYGPHPGDRGSAVIAGHLGVGGPGVFVGLIKLQKGDKLVVVDDKGQTINFNVRELQTYDQASHPSEVFNSSSGTHLNLITCTGTWMAAERTYSQRLVVFADKSI